MPRKSVKNTFIVNDSERKTSYMKRKKSVLKMTEELSTLCDIEACAIIYSPYHREPEIWPSESGVQNVLKKFRTLPEWNQSKKMVNQEGFISRSILKGKEKMRKLKKDNKETEMTIFMFQCLNTGRVRPDNNMTTADLNDLSSIIEQKLKDISTRLETLNVNEMTPYQPQMPIPASQPRFETPTNNPQMQTLPSYPQVQTLPYQPQPEMQTQSLLSYPQVQTLPYQPQPQMQTQTLPYQPEMETQMQTPAPEKTTTLLNYGHRSDMNANSMESEWFMELLNGNLPL